MSYIDLFPLKFEKNVSKQLVNPKTVTANNDCQAIINKRSYQKLMNAPCFSKWHQNGTEALRLNYPDMAQSHF